MIAALDDINRFFRFFRCFIDQPMPAVDAPGPLTGPIMAQRLRVAHAIEGVAGNVLDNGVDAFELLFVGLPRQQAQVGWALERGLIA